MSNKSSKLNLKNIIFDKFYVELLSFFTILFIGTILILCIELKLKVEVVRTILLSLTMILTMISLYSFGYIIAEKRKLLNKYFPSVFFLLIFLVIWFFSSILKDNTGFFTNFFMNSDIMITTIHKYVFCPIDIIFNVDISPRIYSLITPFLVYMGNKKSRKRELIRMKKEKLKNKGGHNGFSSI